MAACKTLIFKDESCGAGMLEVLLAMAIIAMAAPFVYSQVLQTARMASDARMAKDIIDVRGAALNFVRMHADAWPAEAQIRMTDEDLDMISSAPVAGFIDKYAVSGATVTDVYLAFNVGGDALRVENIARRIGVDAAVVASDGIAYGASWAVTAPDFSAGDIIYRVSRDVSGMDTEKYLHRGTSGEDMLNVMMRDLNMGGHNVYDVGSVTAKSAKLNSAAATFIETQEVMADAAYFSSGANIDGGRADLGALRVTGDVTGFKNISAQTLNGSGYTTRGRIIADRATVGRSVNVARDLTLKSDTARTISGFDGISVSSVAAPFITADEIVFYDNFGLTLSGELLMSTEAPLKVGGWTFPSTTPPRFSQLNIERAKYPAPVKKNEFSKITDAGWGGVELDNENSKNVF